MGRAHFLPTETGEAADADEDVGGGEDATPAAAEPLTSLMPGRLPRAEEEDEEVGREEDEEEVEREE